MGAYARRWGDNDRHFGPFLFARDRRYKHLALLISSCSSQQDKQWSDMQAVMETTQPKRGE